jgi:hypothetical protein
MAPPKAPREKADKVKWFDADGPEIDEFGRVSVRCWPGLCRAWLEVLDADELHISERSRELLRADYTERLAEMDALAARGIEWVPPSPLM